MTRYVLGDLLPYFALKEIERLIKQGTCTIENLRQITARYKQELLLKGVDDHYLAWLILHALTVSPPTK